MPFVGMRVKKDMWAKFRDNLQAEIEIYSDKKLNMAQIIKRGNKLERKYESINKRHIWK